ncbi:IclR family transcriptional regulator [Nocardia sp. alder85J]|uniref:IclR family transcriptional regulator n=1 Tax=Nocardia sp. alder85J TaxID=2862949 RepID=UPI001CD7D4E2|nr:IclR family transcriptional regulator [Nocardia sp. alder85J]MCX4095548.1 IclR family transcriptional regulator [Nocardia sp. alder85J]
MPTRQQGPAQEHRTVSRVVTILELVARSPAGMTLAELSTALEAPRSSIHYIVKGLVATGYLVDTGVYTLGPAVEALLGARSASVERIARPAMEALHREFDETVLLCLRAGEQIVYADTIESTRPVRFSAQPGERRPLYPSSAGRCFLAYSSPAFREDYLRRRLPDTALRARVHDELVRIAQDGVSYADQDVTPDLGGVNAPVFRHGTHVAVLTVAGPISRIQPLLDLLRRAVVARAASLTAQLTPTSTNDQHSQTNS